MNYEDLTYETMDLLDNLRDNVKHGYYDLKQLQEIKNKIEELI